MGKALAQMFSFFSTLFTALEKGAKTIDNIAGVGELRSRMYFDEAAHDVAKQRIMLDKELALTN
jgi:protein tyrosine/serine phosphatase